MKKHEIESEKPVETAESEPTTNVSIVQPEVSTDSSNSPILASDKQATENGSLVLSGQYPEADTVTRTLVTRFTPQDELIDFVASNIQRTFGVHRAQSVTTARNLFEKALSSFCNSSEHQDWQDRLQVIFDGNYPKKCREVWLDAGRLSQRRYPKKPALIDLPFTFRAQLFEPIPTPRGLLRARIAPALHKIEFDGKGKPQIKATAEAERFVNGERTAVPRSALIEAVIFNRPLWKQQAGWAEYKANWLPRKVVTVELTCATVASGVLSEFIGDLKNTFAWESDSALASYLAYLIQPMLAHTMPGQLPGYFFCGPSNSGKGYLASVLPSMVYFRPGDSTVAIRQLPGSVYELDVLLDGVRHALYIAFDEVKNANDEQMKSMDSLLTQRTIQVRKFRHGYLEIENHFTVSLTAVHRTFSDETYGRLALIKLKESRPDAITQFHQKWRKHGPEILRALFDAVNSVEIDFSSLPLIPNRRPGFGLMAHVVAKAFGATPEFQLEASNNDVLDDLCKMYEEVPKLGDRKGAWKRFTPRTLSEYLAGRSDQRWKRGTLTAALNTALGYTSTQNHPLYKTTGYPSESGKHYHIKIQEEGQVSKRTYIYVQPVQDGERHD